MIPKYRAWDTKRNKMWSAEEMGKDELTINPDGRGFVNVSSVSLKLSQYFPHLTPLQFTGLFDKRGKEIYNSDCIKAEHGYVEYFGEVIFDTGSFCLKIKNSSEGCNGHPPDYSNGQTPELNNFDSMEIVGNIYETSESQLSTDNMRLQENEATTPVSCTQPSSKAEINMR